VNSAPHDTWMIKVELANPADADALMSAADYEATLAH
jgi:glycine cleavage system H protein